MTPNRRPCARRRQDEVLAHGLGQQQTLLAAVLGQEHHPDPRRHRVPRAADGHRPAADARPGHGRGSRRTAPGTAPAAHDPPARRRPASRPRAAQSRRHGGAGPTVKAVDLQGDPVRGGRDARREQAGEPPSQHHRHDVVVGEIGRGLGAHGLAIAQHRHPVGDAPDLVHAVRDVQHERARVAHAHGPIRRSQSTWRGQQRRRGLVEDEDVRALLRQRLGDLDQLLLPRGSATAPAVRIDAPAGRESEQGPGAGLDPTPRDGPQRGQVLARRTRCSRRPSGRE